MALRSIVVAGHHAPHLDCLAANDLGTFVAGNAEDEKGFMDKMSGES